MFISVYYFSVGVNVVVVVGVNVAVAVRGTAEQYPDFVRRHVGYHFPAFLELVAYVV